MVGRRGANIGDKRELRDVGHLEHAGVVVERSERSKNAFADSAANSQPQSAFLVGAFRLRCLKILDFSTLITA